jgi:hypothetical protein
MATTTTITQFNTVTVSPGGVVYIPKDAVIISKTSTGNSNISSDCIDLTTIEDFSCFVLMYELGPDTSPSSPNEHQDTYLTGLKIMGTDYIIPDISADNLTGFQDWLNSNGLSSIFQYNNFDDTPGLPNNRYGKSIFFKTTPSIAETIELKITSALTPPSNTFYIKPITSEDCI